MGKQWSGRSGKKGGGIGDVNGNRSKDSQELREDQRWEKGRKKKSG